MASLPPGSSPHLANPRTSPTRCTGAPGAPGGPRCTTHPLPSECLVRQVVKIVNQCKSETIKVQRESTLQKMVDILNEN